MRKIIFFFIIVVAAVSCNKNKVPTGILPPEKMEAVMWDMMQADEFVKGFIIPYDSLANDTTASIYIYKKVFQLNNISKEEYEKSFEYYKVHTLLMKEVLDSLNVKAQKAPTELYAPVLAEDTISSQHQDTVKPLTDTSKKVKRFLKPVSIN